MKGVVLDNGSIIDCFVYIVILDSACGSPCADKLVVALQKTILVNLYLRPWLMPRESTWGPKKPGLLPPNNRHIAAGSQIPPRSFLLLGAGGDEDCTNSPL